MINVQTSKTFSNDSTESANETIGDINSEYAGKHFIVDFWQAQHLQDMTVIEAALSEASNVAGATLLHIHIHKFTEGGGVTGVALLAESHISVHTWPERDYAAFDIFMCGDTQADKALAHLVDVFQPKRKIVSEILRGSVGPSFIDD